MPFAPITWNLGVVSWGLKLKSIPTDPTFDVFLSVDYPQSVMLSPLMPTATFAKSADACGPFSSCDSCPAMVGCTSTDVHLFGSVNRALSIVSQAAEELRPLSAVCAGGSRVSVQLNE